MTLITIRTFRNCNVPSPIRLIRGIGLGLIVAANTAGQSVRDVRTGLMRAVQYTAENDREAVDVFVDSGAELGSF